MRTDSAILIAAGLLALLLGCVSTARPEAIESLTIERLLTEPLTGVTGRDQVRSELIQIYGIDSPTQKHIRKERRSLSDRHVLSMFWLEPLPADFFSIAVSAEPCFPTDRALRLTQAKPHSETRPSSAQTYDAFRNGMLVSFSTTPDEKCVAFIHIERDR